MKDIVFNLAGHRKYEDEALGIRGLPIDLHIAARHQPNTLLYSEPFWQYLQRLRQEYFQEAGVTHVLGQTVHYNPTILMRAKCMATKLLLIQAHSSWYQIVFVN